MGGQAAFAPTAMEDAVGRTFLPPKCSGHSHAFHGGRFSPRFCARRNGAEAVRIRGRR